MTCTDTCLGIYNTQMCMRYTLISIFTLDPTDGGTWPIGRSTSHGQQFSSFIAGATHDGGMTIRPKKMIKPNLP